MRTNQLKLEKKTKKKQSAILEQVILYKGGMLLHVRLPGIVYLTLMAMLGAIATGEICSI